MLKTHLTLWSGVTIVAVFFAALNSGTARAEPKAETRHPVPAAAEVETARHRLRRDLADLVDLNPVSQPVEWAQFLVDQTKWHDTTSHYAALFEAAELAATSDNVGLAVQALDGIHEHFAADIGKMTAVVISKCAATKKLSDDSAGKWIDEVEIWMLDQRFADCVALLKALELSVDQPSDKLNARLEQMSEESTVYSSWFAARPEGDLTDAAQREAEGRCLAVSDEWELAVKLLADARDVNLRKAASVDQRASDGMASAADACQAWLRVIATQPLLRVWQMRAEHWYEVVASGERTPAVVNLERRMKRLGLVKTTAVSKRAVRPAPDLILRQTHLAHTGIVSSVDFSRDGTTYCSAGEDAAIKIWKNGDKEPFQVLTGHEGAVFGVALSHDSKFLASGGRDKLFRVWNIQTGQPTAYSATHTVSIRDVAFSGNSKWAASVSDDRKVALWALQTETPLVVPGHQGIVYAVDVSSKGTWVASGCEDRMVHVFRPANSPQVVPLTGHQSPVHAVAFSPDERRLVSGDATGVLMVWDLSDGSSETVDAHQGIVTGISFASEGRWLATCGKDATIHVWDAAKLEKRQTIGPLSDEIRDVAFSPDGRTLVVASKDGKVLVYRRGS